MSILLLYIYSYAIAMKFKWKIIEKSPVEQINDDLKKQTLHIKENKEWYPWEIIVTFFNKDKILKDKNEWDTVEVYYNVSVSQYNWKKYNNIIGRRIKKIESIWEISEQEDDSDLPF